MNTQSSIEPYLFKFATPRSGEIPDMAGHYCEKRKVRVVDVNGESRPIIEEASDMLGE